MRDLRTQVDELAELMERFGLEHASLRVDDFTVTFRRRKRPLPSPSSGPFVEDISEEVPEEAPAPEPDLPKGQSVSSPMAGIFYLSSGPGTTPFVKLGDSVMAGQTIGLIEAMKVFNEIPSPFAGVVLEILAESGAVVQPGQALIRIG